MALGIPISLHSYTSPEVASTSFGPIAKAMPLDGIRAARTSSTQSSTLPEFAYRGDSASFPWLILPSRAWSWLELLSMLLELGRLLVSAVSAWVPFVKFSSNWFLKFETRNWFMLGVFWLVLAAVAVYPRKRGGWRGPFSKIGSVIRYYHSRSAGGLYSESDWISAGLADFVSRLTGSKKPLSSFESVPTGFLGFGWRRLSYLKRWISWQYNWFFDQNYPDWRSDLNQRGEMFCLGSRKLWAGEVRMISTLLGTSGWGKVGRQGGLSYTWKYLPQICVIALAHTENFGQASTVPGKTIPQFKKVTMKKRETFLCESRLWEDKGS